MSKKFRSMIVMYPNGMQWWRVGCTGRRSLKGANPWVHSLQKMMKFQTSRKVFIILCLFQLLMILKWNVGRLYLKRSHRGLGERFWTTDTEILFQRYWWTTRRFFHQKLESHWSILSTASEKLAQQYFFWPFTLLLCLMKTNNQKNDTGQDILRWSSCWKSLGNSFCNLLQNRPKPSRNFGTQIFLEAYPDYPKPLIGPCPEPLEKYGK